MNNEGTTVRLPGDDVIMTGAMSALEHGMQFEREGFDNSVGLDLAAGDGGIAEAGGQSVAAFVVDFVGLGYLGPFLVASSTVPRTLVPSST